MMAVETHSESVPVYSFIWRESMIERLVELFKQHPCLYDSNNEHYHNKDHRKVILDEIANELGTDSKFCVRGRPHFYFLVS